MVRNSSEVMPSRGVPVMVWEHLTSMTFENLAGVLRRNPRKKAMLGSTSVSLLLVVCVRCYTRDIPIMNPRGFNMCVCVCWVLHSCCRVEGEPMRGLQMQSCKESQDKTNMRRSCLVSKTMSNLGSGSSAVGSKEAWGPEARRWLGVVVDIFPGPRATVKCGKPTVAFVLALVLTGHIAGVGLGRPSDMSLQMQVLW